MKGLRAWQHTLVRTALVAGLAAAVSTGIMQLPFMRSLEAASLDLRELAFAPPTEASPDIVIVSLDESTMRSLPYRSPIPRDFLAKLATQLSAARPKLVAYDIFFKDPSFAQADAELAATLMLAPSYSVVPQRADGSVDEVLPMFAASLRGTGLADLPFNPFDATVRAAQLSFSTPDGERPTFAAMLAEAATGVAAGARFEDRVAWPRWLGSQLTPFVEGRQFLIRFAGPPGKVGGADNAFKIYSARVIAEGLIPSSWLADKIVLVGAGDDDLKDAFLTPYYARATQYARMSGVEIHANVLNQLLTQQHYFFLPSLQRWIGAIALALGAAWLALRVNPPMALGGCLAMCLGWLWMVAWACGARAVMLPAVQPVTALLMSLGIAIAWRALTEGRQKKFITSAFAQYVPPEVVQRLVDDPQHLQLGGEQRVVTSLFSDIASFTSISERLDAATLVRLLNEYLGKMNDVLFAHGATLDKYEGDAIIAFFNAPLETPKHEEQAVRAALAMQSATDEVSRAWKEQLPISLVTRIGINTGAAVVGNMGSQSRFDYTAIGDTINLASRLEGTNKMYGTRVMCSEHTAQALPPEIVVRPVDRVRVKGKAEAVMLYEVVGLRDVLEERRYAQVIAPCAEIFHLIDERVFSDAERMLFAVLAADAQDGPALALQQRLHRAMNEPTWDLVTELQGK